MSEDRVRLLTQARASARDQHFVDAYRQYDALLKANPADFQVLLDYGRTKYLEYDDLEGATALFERAVEAQPDSIEALLWLADFYSLGYGRGYAGAADLYRQVMTRDRTNTDAYIGLGMLHRAPGMPVARSDAVQAFRTAAQLDPQRADAYRNLGMLLLESGNVPAAREALTTAHRLLERGAQQRQARGIVSILERIAKGEVVTGTTYSNASRRYNWPEQSDIV